MKKFVRMTKNVLIIIDPYFGDCVLPIIAQKRLGMSVPCMLSCCVIV